MSLSLQESHDIYEEAFADISQRFDSTKVNNSNKIPGTEKKGYSPIYKNALHPETIKLHHHKLDTLEKYFQNAVNLYGEDDCFGERLFDNTIKGQFDKFYTFQSFNKINERRINFGSGLINLVRSNSKTGQNTKLLENGKPNFIVGIYSRNAVEFLLTDIACATYSLPNTSLYDTLGPAATKHILDLTEAPVLVLNKNKIETVLDLKANQGLDNLHILISTEPLNKQSDSKLFAQSEKLGIELVDYATVEKIGSLNRLDTLYNPPKTDTIHHICFTSGTTGLPKGVIVTHANTISYFVGTDCLSRFSATSFLKKGSTVLNNRDDEGNQFRNLCGLPLAHIYEKTHTLYLVSKGVATGVPSLPGVQSIVDDWKAAKPHTIAGVPRLWSKIEQGIKFLLKDFDLNVPNAPEIDRLLLRNKLRKYFGMDRTRYLGSGSAAISKATMEFLTEQLGIMFVQGYGLTETTSAVMCSSPFSDNYKPSAVGGVYATAEVRLKDVPSLNYYSTDKPYPRGEILVRGVLVTPGYYKNEKATKEAFEDGFFKTGDIGMIDDNGQVHIIDRVKNFFKLSQGEYIAPERIENVYMSSSPLLSQIYIHGDGLQSFLVAVVGLEPIAFKMLLSSIGIKLTNDADLAKYFNDPKIKRTLIQVINKHIKDSGLQGFEKIHNAYFDLEPLKIEEDILTPTMKLKRENARKKFKKIMDDLYSEGSLFKTQRL